MNPITRRIALVLCLLVFAGLAWWGSRLLWARHQLQRADQAASDFNFDLACDHACAAANVFSDDGAVGLRCAALARKAGRYAEAQERLHALDSAIISEPDKAWEQLFLLGQQGELTLQQEHHLAPLLQAQPSREAEALAALAQGYLKSYRIAEAHELIEVLLARNENDAFAHYLRGLLREGVQQIPDALSSYEEAVSLRPAFFAARLRLAETQLAQNDPSRAKTHFDELVRQRPGNFEATVGLARSLRLLDRAEEAERLLVALSSAFPERPAVWHERGNLALADSRPDEAEHHLRRALAGDSHDPNVIYGLAQSLAQQGRLKEAEELRQKHQALKADLDELRRLHEELGRQPQGVEKRCQAAVICFRNGQDAEALRWLAGALRFAPQDQDAHRLLMEHYERNGQKSLAEEHRRHLR